MAAVFYSSIQVMDAMVGKVSENANEKSLKWGRVCGQSRVYSLEIQKSTKCSTQRDALFPSGSPFMQ